MNGLGGKYSQVSASRLLEEEVESKNEKEEGGSVAAWRGEWGESNKEGKKDTC
jgi:phage-related minor tail protein